MHLNRQDDCLWPGSGNWPCVQKQREFHCGETWNGATSIHRVQWKSFRTLVVGLMRSTFFVLCVVHKYSSNSKDLVSTASFWSTKARKIILMQDLCIRIYKTESWHGFLKCWEHTVPGFCQRRMIHPWFEAADSTTTFVRCWVATVESFILRFHDRVTLNGRSLLCVTLMQVG